MMMMKIEELTLYMIEFEKHKSRLEKRIIELEN